MNLTFYLFCAISKFGESKHLVQAAPLWFGQVSSDRFAASSTLFTLVVSGYGRTLEPSFHPSVKVV